MRATDEPEGRVPWRARAASLHPFDRSMALTSIYIALAAWHVQSRGLRLLMCLQTVASTAHWLAFDVAVWRVCDIALSNVVFGVHLWLLAASPPAEPRLAATFAVCAAGFFCCSVRTRPHDAAQRDYSVRTLLFPHPIFRFAAFWFVMAVHGRRWCVWTSATYWVTVVVLGWPRPRTASCAGVKEFFTWQHRSS